jgi:hypothetical protein
VLSFFLSLLLLAALTGCGVLGFLSIQQKKQIVELSAKLQDCQNNSQGMLQQRDKLLIEIKELAPFKSIKDAEIKVRARLQQSAEKLQSAEAQAKEIISRAMVDAEQLIASEKEKSKTELADMKAKLRKAKDELNIALNSATTESAKIIDEAREKAKTIAGEAYHIAQNASLYENTVKAMKNLIEGYGNEYIIPEQSLLDDLADDFSHTEAGQKLKAARDRVAAMVRSGKAATCDYVETNRRETAINFVLDAFNGKVDSIQSRVKHDNAGILTQSIRDAFTLVNYNGKAFKDARILEEYLDARLDELKWAEIAQQISLKDREEQRLAKEKIREEAKALKEQQKALAQALKEEEILEKALAQARIQFDEASGEQRDKYEERLKEMEQKLKEAGDKKDRAKSMAEQTKKGYVYIISNIGSFGDDVYKIGLTRRYDPQDRIKELGDSSVPFGYDVHAMILADDAPALEHQLHRHFLMRQINKVNPRKEFFKVKLSEVKEEIEKLNITTGVKWTMTSEASEYRQTLAIESAIASDPQQKEKWIKRQLSLDSQDFENEENAED